MLKIILLSVIQEKSFNVFATFNLLATNLDKIICMCILLYLHPCGIFFFFNFFFDPLIIKSRKICHREYIYLIFHPFNVQIGS